MMMQRVRATLTVAVLGGALALAPMASAHASIAKSSKHHTTKHKAKKKAPKKKGSSTSASGAFSCTDYGNYQDLDTSLGSKFVSAFESGNVAAVKSDMAAEIATFNKDSSALESHFGGAPSNVVAAFNVLISNFKTLGTEIQSATTMTAIESDFENFGTGSSLKSASQTLEAYYDKTCHVTPTTVSVPSVP